MRGRREGGGLGGAPSRLPKPKLLDKPAPNSNNAIMRTQSSQRLVAEDALRKVQEAKTQEDLRDALAAVAGMYAALGGTALSTLPPSPVLDPVSLLTLPVPPPIVPFAERKKRYALTTDELRAHIDLSWKKYWLSGILMLEDICHADRRLYETIRYKARTEGLSLHEYAMQHLQIVSGEIITADPPKYPRQHALYKALGHFNEAITHLKSAQAEVNALAASV